MSVQYLLRKSRVYSMIDHIVPALLDTQVVDPDAPGWRESMRSLAEIANYGRERGMGLVVFLYRMTEDPKTDALYAQLSAVAREEGFLLADALPAFEGQELRGITNSFIDSHPNARGHSILADHIAEVLMAGGLLPTPGVQAPATPE